MANTAANNDSSRIAEYVIKNIDTAIANGWIKIYYQPVIRSLTGELCGAESLARWADPELGLLPPDKFIGALEASRQIHKLDCFMVEQVCRDISERLRTGLPAVPVSVNFSRLDFEATDMLGVVEGAVEKYNIPRDFIHIEITESMIVSDADLMTNIINNFRSSGYEVWMDDFGSGYSSLTLIKDYTFDTLKLDMGFLSDLSDKTRAIITSTVTMAKNINCMTLAEGVETTEQIEFLREIGCGKLQGFFYGKPMPLEDFFSHIATRNITIEDRKWRHFYDIASFSARATDEPLEVLEDDGKEFRTLFMNAPYKRQIFEKDYSLQEIDRLVYHTASPLLKKYRQFADLMEKSGNREIFYYTNNGNILCFQAQVIARNSGRYIIEGSIRNLSADISVSKRNSLDYRLKELNHLFEVVLLITPENDSVVPLLGKFSYIPDYDAYTTCFSQRHQSFVKRSVASEDIERFKSFMDTVTLRERIESSPKGYISDLFRLKQDNGCYDWREISIMIIPGTKGREFLYCIKALPDNALNYLQASSETSSTASEKTSRGGVQIDSQMWTNIVNNTTIKFFWKDKNRKFLGASKAFLEYYGLPSVKSILGKTDEDMSWHIDEKTYRDNEESILNEGAHIYNVPTQCIINGVTHNIVSNKLPLYKGGKIVGIIGYFADVEEELSRMGAVSGASKLDSVTGLMGAKSLTDAMIDYAVQYHENQKDYGLIVLRNRNHDRITETYGNEFSNRLLKEIGRTILSVTGSSCAVSRPLSSDFALLTHVSEISELEFLANEIRSAIESITELDGNAVTLRISVAFRLRSLQTESDESLYQLTLADLTSQEQNPGGKKD